MRKNRKNTHKKTSSSGPKKPSENTVVGEITEALPNTFFRVLLPEGEEIIAFLSGKMRMYRIKVLVGDKVEVVKDPYGGKGRIVKRL